MSLYGFVGKLQSGKDTVAKIWQGLDIYATHKDNFNASEKDYILNYYLKGDSLMFKSEWQRKAFADKLKQVVALITGCRPGNLHDETFKNSVAPKFNGQYSYTYRELLQFVGTDLFRNQLGEDVWINALFADYKYEKCPVPDRERCVDDCNSVCWKPLQKWLIPDVRFLNEAFAVHTRNGKLIRVIKHIPDNIPYDEDKHISETEQKEIAVDYTISAVQGDLEGLIDQVKEIMIKEKVIEV